jgi:hypothetical protein
MIRTAFCAAFIVALSAGGSVALPASAGATHESPALERSNIVQAQYKKRHTRRHWNRHHGRRYHSPPPGWHRYHRRPWDWQRRGCMAIGPVWFCP